MIPIRTHAFLDYAVGAALVLLPALLLPPEAITARWAMMLAGVVALVYSAATDYDWSLVRWIPFRTHLKLDAGLGLFLVGAPWILGFADVVLWPHVAAGALVLTVTALTAWRAPAR
jgi:hypothetical protein